MLQALQGSEVVELNLGEGKMRRKDNPTMWVIPADQPFTGELVSLLDWSFTSLSQYFYQNH